MECKEVERKMLAFICDNLPQHEEKILKNHIQTCHGCKQMFNKFNMLKDSIKKIELNGEEVFIKNTMSRINELQQRRFTYRLRDVSKNVFKKRKWIAYATTILLILIVFGYTLGLFNIFKPQEVNAQEILIKSLTSPEEVKSYHMKGRLITYIYGKDDKQEYKLEKWFKTPDKCRGNIILTDDVSSEGEIPVTKIIIVGNKNWQSQKDGEWVLTVRKDWDETTYCLCNINEVEKIRSEILKLQKESETNLIKEDKIADREVYVIEYLGKLDSKYIFYIDKKTFLILALKEYYEDSPYFEVIYNTVEYNIEIDDKVFNPSQEVSELIIEEAPPMDCYLVDSIEEAEKMVGFKINLPEYIPEEYKKYGLDIISVSKPTYPYTMKDSEGKEVEVDESYFMNVGLNYDLSDSSNDKYLYISLKGDNYLTDCCESMLFIQENFPIEKLLFDQDLEVSYQSTPVDHSLCFSYNDICINILATLDISKDELIKIANSMLD